MQIALPDWNGPLDFLSQSKTFQQDLIFFNQTPLAISPIEAKGIKQKKAQPVNRIHFSLANICGFLELGQMFIARLPRRRVLVC